MDLNGVIFTENALFLPKSKTLVIADLQLGQEQQLRKLGHNIRYEQGEKMLRLLERLIQQHDAKTLVINGDVKHEFGRISGQERRDVLGLLRKLKRRVDIVLVRGNHDTITKPLADEEHVPFVDQYIIDDVLLVHGHELVAIPRNVKTIVIGHMHPAIVLSDGVRREKFKCFLTATYKRKHVIVLPSFSTLTEGVDVLTAESNTPFLTDRSLKKAEVYVLADEIRAFGRVEKVGRRLIG